MRQSMRKRWIYTGLLGAFLIGTVPADWNTVHVFASETAYVTTARDLQSEMAEGMKARRTTMTIKYKGPTKNLESLLKKAVNGALDSDPYTKYIVDRYTYTWRGTSGAAKIVLSVNYRESAEESAYVNKRIKAILASMITADMNDHQKIKAIHDYVVQNLKYDKELQKYTAYEGLRTGQAVCQGYALLTYKLLEGAGFSNLIVEGKAGGQLHAWNLVQVDKKWYHLDTTWDDPLSASSEQLSYAYYMRTDEQMRKDHRWTLKYPTANTLYRDTLKKLASRGGAEAASYSILVKQLGFHLYDPSAAISSEAELRDKVQEELNNGALTVTVRYSGTERRLIQNLGSLYELSIGNIRYLTEPLEGTDDLRVEIHWDAI